MALCNKRWRVSAGFSLIELMIVVAIMGIAMGIAVPAMKDLVGAQRVKSAALDFGSAMVFARTEALKRANDVTVVAKSNNDFATGWCVLYGDLAATDCDLESPGTKVLRIQQPLSRMSMLFNVSADEGPIVFNSSGRLKRRGSQVKLQFSDTDGGHRRCMVLEVTGTTSSSSGSC